VRDITIANFFIKFSANAESRHEDQRGAMTGVACDDLLAILRFAVHDFLNELYNLTHRNREDAGAFIIESLLPLGVSFRYIWHH